MKNLLRHYFLPHHTNNQKAKILHHDSLLILSVVFLIGTFFLTNVHKTYSQVLGNAINISVQELLQLTNQKREVAGVGPLTLNGQLSQAADKKAKDMFTQNYWAHNNPQGRMPWDFIKDAGYDYSFAGENLARGFSSASDVIDAWMASPSHKENMLSPNYHDVGFSLQEGTLTGEKDTILVVEEFGNKTFETNMLGSNSTVQQALAVSAQKSPNANAAIIQTPVINASVFTRNLSVFLLTLFILIFLVDLLIVKRKSILRVVSHNMDHVFFLCVVLVSVFLLQSGAIF